MFSLFQVVKVFYGFILVNNSGTHLLQKRWHVSELCWGEWPELVQSSDPAVTVLDTIKNNKGNKTFFFAL